MKRLTFKAQHVEPILSGSKTVTMRWRDQKLNAGETVAAVSGRNGKPAFLTPAAEAFAQLRIVSVERKPWGDFTEADAARCGVTRDWYLRERPSPADSDPVCIYEFKWVG